MFQQSDPLFQDKDYKATTSEILRRRACALKQGDAVSICTRLQSHLDVEHGGNGIIHQEKRDLLIHDLCA